MKALKCNLFVALLLVLAVQCGFAKDEFTRTIEKEFPVTPNDRFRFNGKFSNVSIENHDKPVIHIRIELKTSARDQAAADQKFDKIQIEIGKKDGEVFATTSPKIEGGQAPEIAVFVMMPHYIASSVTNKFGDVTIAELSKRSDITVEYGNLTAARLLFDDGKPVGKIDLSYSSGEIRQAKWLDVTMKYSNLSVGSAKALTFNTRFSNIEITELQTIILKSKYDNYDLGILTSLVVESGFTNIEVNEVRKEINATLEYGALKIMAVPVGFDEITIDSKFTDTRLIIAPEAAYHLQAALEYCDLDLPKGSSLQKTETSTRIQYSGQLGKGDTSSKVKITSRYGDVSLR